MGKDVSMEPDKPTTGAPTTDAPVPVPDPAISHAAALEKKRATLLATVSWLRDLFLSVLIAIVVILFLYQPVKVEGTSMMPGLIDQERIFINKFAYRFGISDIQRGDTVVFWYPGDPSKSFIKRVIGVPGDNVVVNDEIGRAHV